jgi:hypothetical protein
MKSVRELLADRRRSQRGSVLSGVLIIVAFLAIISGAMMTELSTNFLLSSRLVDRVATEATVDSATELAISDLQDTRSKPLYRGCPSLGGVTLNGATAIPAYSACWPVIDSRTSQSFIRVTSSSAAYQVDGTHAVIGMAGVDEYLTGDANGNVSATPIGRSSPGWSVALGGETTGSPVAIPDPSGPPDDISYLVPVTSPNGTGCGPAKACVALLSGDSIGTPGFVCFMPAGGPVLSAPAQGANYPQLAYFGDSRGTLFAYSTTSSGQCDSEISAPLPGGAGMVAGPFVFATSIGSRLMDEVYAVVSNGSTASLVHYTFSSGSKGPALTLTASLALPVSGMPAGAALDQSTLPARLAISFTNGGGVVLAQISSTLGMSILGTTQLPAASSDAPFWCQCPGGANLIGFGANDGVLYVLDTNLNLYASSSGGAPIAATPGADAGGDWFVAANDGTVTELQKSAGTSTMAVVAQYGSSGAISSAPVVTACPAGICVYFASLDHSVYLVQLDARDVVVTSCISSSPPACDQGINPRLWTKLEVGVAGNPQAVRVLGWSYYSP